MCVDLCPGLSVCMCIVVRVCTNSQRLCVRDTVTPLCAGVSPDQVNKRRGAVLQQACTDAVGTVLNLHRVGAATSLC